MSARIEADKLVADFLLSEATLYRSREVITIPQGPAPLSSGTLLTMAGAAATAANVAAILMYPVDPRQGSVRAAVIARDAEVNDAYLLYGSLDRDAVNATLGGRNIIVRHGVVEESIVTPTTGENLWSDTQPPGARPTASQSPPEAVRKGS